MSGTASSTSANGFRNVTVSTASPSGGSDGDVWIRNIKRSKYDYNGG